MTSIKESIRDRLTGDDTYMGYLGEPIDNFMRTYYLIPPEKPQLPIVVFSITPNEYEAVDRDILSSVGDLNINVWAKTNVYEDIAERIIYLLHHDTSMGMRVIMSREPNELYDQELDAYGKNLLFNLYYRRAMI